MYKQLYVQPNAEINSVPKTEVKAESLHEFSKSLSPYPSVILSFTAYEFYNIFLLHSMCLEFEAHELFTSD